MRRNDEHDANGHMIACTPITRERIDEAKAKLLTPSERAELERALGAVAGPLIDQKLEAKAVELIGRYEQSWSKLLATWNADTTDRSQLLVSRDEVAQMLGVSLSTVKRMESTGELEEPIKFNERVVRHRLVAIERLARTRKMHASPN
ncbi:MAG: hypothetical protein AAGG99_05525 [Pseudomonadota bacterium]